MALAGFAQQEQQLEVLASVNGPAYKGRMLT